MKDLSVILGICVISFAIGGGLFWASQNGTEIAASSSVEQVVETHVASSTPVTFTPIASGTFAAFVSTEENDLASTKEGLTDLWNMIYGKKAPTFPVVNFSKEQVIAVFAGQEPTGGYGIKISAITDTADKRIVSIMLTKPGKGCVTTEALTAPYELVRVPASDLPLAHEYTKTSVPCD